MTKEQMTRGYRLGPLARAVLRTQSDDRLVALAREGREAAFEEIVRRYRPGLVAFAAAYAPSDRAEDVVQESLVRSWEALGQSSEDIHLKPWLYTIVRNRALNARRDAKTHEPLSEQIDGVPQPPDLVLGKAELAAVVGAVNALPTPQREALVRSAVEGHTHDQIAEALGSSTGAVRQLIYRARLNLRTGMGMLIPLPLVRMLAEHGTETAAAGGVAAGGAALGAAGGASAVAKVATLAAIGTIAAGAGVAIEQAKDDRSTAKGAQTRAERQDNGGGGSGRGGGATPAGAAGGEREFGDHSGSSSDDGPGDSSGPSGSGEDGHDNSGPGGGDGDDDGGGHSGPGGGDDEPPERDDDDSSGPGSGDDEPPERDDDGSSGPGSGDDEPPERDDDGSSGPGGGDADDSSGPGSGDDDPLEPGDDSSGSGSGDGEPDLDD